MSTVGQSDDGQLSEVVIVGSALVAPEAQLGVGVYWVHTVPYKNYKACKASHAIEKIGRPIDARRALCEKAGGDKADRAMHGEGGLAE